MWICPACSESLNQDNKTWRCINGHAFDQAKEGYINLQLAQERKSKAPGDSAQMITARRTFLNADHYLPLVIKLSELIKAHIHSDDITLFDAGCGEGYYLDKVYSAINTEGTKVSALGCDISKPAIQKAAKAYKNHQFCVASTFKLPLPTQSIDAMIQVFAPLSNKEAQRVLKDNGVWISVNPASRHLHQLKAMIYQQNREHQTIQEVREEFVLLDSQTLEFTMTLSSDEERLALLMMTPFYWQSTEQTKQTLQTQLATCDAHFDIKIWKKQ